MATRVERISTPTPESEYEPCSPKLFQPIKIGNLTLDHRIVLSPMTRLRADKSSVPVLPIVKEYYSQRSSIRGTLLICEGTIIAERAGGRLHHPGIWNEDQIRAWKEITDAIHANGSYTVLQLFALGRGANPDILFTLNPKAKYDVVAPSPLPLSTNPSLIPRELTTQEVEEYVETFAQAASNAVHKAGFDGVEIQSANGYLVDQFLSGRSNERTDRYGGSVEARCTFGLEIIKVVASVVGEERVGCRLSPWSNQREVAMDDPIPQHSHFVSMLKERHPKLAYLHVVEPRMEGNTERKVASHESINFLHKIWSPLPMIVAGGHTRETAIRAAEEGNILVAFGRYFISNPDLPKRLRDGLPLQPYDRATFYGPVGGSPGAEQGYIDYPFFSDERCR